MLVKQFVEMITDQRLPAFTKGLYGVESSKDSYQPGGKFFLAQTLYVTKLNGKIIITNRSF